MNENKFTKTSWIILRICFALAFIGIFSMAANPDFGAWIMIVGLGVAMLYLFWLLSHYNIWMEKYYQEYKVDFDYYPRGRIVYRKIDNTFLIYYDRCMELQLDKIIDKFQNVRYELNYDEHYQCHTCNKGYVI